MPERYCVFKGTLVRAAPFFHSYRGNPHYAIIVTSDGGEEFTILVNSASRTQHDGSNNVFFCLDKDFQATNPTLASDLKNLDKGLHLADFPQIDYCHGQQLFQWEDMFEVPPTLHGKFNDVNDFINEALGLDIVRSPSDWFDFKYTPDKSEERRFFEPLGEVTVYGFGFLFNSRDGLHETHMNQGNTGSFASSNRAGQDGALFVEQNGKFYSIFTAFQTQKIPTREDGSPAADARYLDELIEAPNA